MIELSKEYYLVDKKIEEVNEETKEIFVIIIYY